MGASRSSSGMTSRTLLARERRVDDGDDLVFAVADQAVGGLGVTSGEPDPRPGSRTVVPEPRYESSRLNPQAGLLRE